LDSTHQGRVTNITDYGAFVELEPGVEGLVHVSEMSWTKKNVHPGKIVSTSQEVEVMVLEIDSAKRRVSLGLKQTQRNPWEVFAENNPVGKEIEGEDGGVEVEYEGAKSFIRRSDLSRDRAEQRPERFQVGDKVDVRVTNVDAKTRRLGLSIKAREIAEEKEAVEQYGSSDSGASLGDILGAALKSDD